LKSDIDTHIQSSFTFPDKLGVFTRWIFKQGHYDAEDWQSNPPEYHIVVKTTLGDLYSEFRLESAQLELVSFSSYSLLDLTDNLHSQARKYNELYSSQACPKKVYILVRLFNIDATLGIALYIDPWVSYQAGEILLEPRAGYRGNIVKPKSGDEK
jgi:hypothetical protein